MTEMPKDDEPSEKKDITMSDSFNNLLDKATQLKDNIPESVKRLMEQAKQMGMSAMVFKETFSKYLKQDSTNNKKNSTQNPTVVDESLKNDQDKNNT